MTDNCAGSMYNEDGEKSVPSEFPFSQLHEQPSLLVIGVDAASDKLLVLSGQQAHCLTTDDLVHMIETLPQSPAPRGVGGNSPP